MDLDSGWKNGTRKQKPSGRNRTSNKERITTMQEFPTIGKYKRTLQKKGSNAFRTLGDLEIIPSRTSPIKVYLHGSGAYAAVFKGRRQNQTMLCDVF